MLRVIRNPGRPASTIASHGPEHDGQTGGARRGRRLGSAFLEQLLFSLRHRLHERADVVHGAFAAPRYHHCLRGGKVLGPTRFDVPCYLRQLVRDQRAKRLEREPAAAGCRSTRSASCLRYVSTAVMPLVYARDSLVSRDHVAALAGFGILQCRHDLVMLRNHLVGMCHPLRISTCCPTLR